MANLDPSVVGLFFLGNICEPLRSSPVDPVTAGQKSLVSWFDHVSCSYLISKQNVISFSSCYLLLLIGSLPRFAPGFMIMKFSAVWIQCAC